MNNYIKTDKKINIIIYDKNSDEMRILKKYRQLVDLGFTNVYIYTGGLFSNAIARHLWINRIPNNHKKNWIFNLFKNIRNNIANKLLEYKHNIDPRPTILR